VAGTQYSKQLNMDQNYVKTPAVYDSNLDEWLMLAGNYVKTAGGLWVPQKGSDNGEALVQLTGSVIEKTQIAEGVTITAGSTANIVTSDIDISDSKYIAILVAKTNISEGSSHHGIEIRYKLFGSLESMSVLMPLVDGKTTLINYLAHTEMVQVISPTARFSIKNDDTVDTVINAYLIKTKR